MHGRHSKGTAITVGNGSHGKGLFHDGKNQGQGWQGNSASSLAETEASRQEDHVRLEMEQLSQSASDLFEDFVGDVIRFPVQKSTSSFPGCVFQRD